MTLELMISILTLVILILGITWYIVDLKPLWQGWRLVQDPGKPELVRLDGRYSKTQSRQR